MSRAAVKSKDGGVSSAPYPVIVVEVDGSLVVSEPLRRVFEFLIPFEPEPGDLLCWDGKYWQVARYKGVRYPRVRQTFERALQLLIDEYRQRGVVWDVIACDLQAAAGAVVVAAKPASAGAQIGVES